MQKYKSFIPFFFIFYILTVLFPSLVKGQNDKKSKIYRSKSYSNLEWKIHNNKIENEARWILSNNDRYIGHFNLKNHFGNCFLCKSNDTLLVTRKDTVYCLNCISGEKYWIKKYEWTGIMWNSKANVIVSGHRELRGVNKKTGTLIWRDDKYKAVYKKYNSEKNIFFLEKDSLIVGLDGESGKKVWEYIHNFPLRLLTTHDNVLLGKGRDSLYCIDLLNKRIKWKKRIEKCFTLKSSDNDRLFKTRNDSVFKLDFNNGKVLLENSIKCESDVLNLLSTSRGIVTKRMDGKEVYLWDLESGKIIWTYKIPKQEQLQTAHYKPIKADKRTLYLNTKQGILRAINLKTGKLLWEFDTYSRVISDLIIEDGVLYVINSTGQVIAIDTNLKDGVQKWKNVRDF